MKKKTALVFLLLISFVFIGSFSFVSADEDNDLVASKSAGIYQKDRLSDEIINTRDTYRGQLESYRISEKSYRIAIDQYKKHQTLDSISKAVKATKNVMLVRAEVLRTYHTLLKLRLIESEGIEIRFKEQTLEYLDEDINHLSEHIDKVNKAEDRLELNELSDEFKPFGKILKQTSQQTIVLLTLGKLQNSYDKALLLKQDVFDEVDESDRDIIETERILKKSETYLVEYWGKIGDQIEEKKLHGMYNTISKDLNPVYVSLSQTVSYYYELLDL